MIELALPIVVQKSPGIIPTRSGNIWLTFITKFRTPRSSAFLWLRRRSVRESRRRGGREILRCISNESNFPSGLITARRIALTRIYGIGSNSFLPIEIMSRDTYNAYVCLRTRALPVINFCHVDANKSSSLSSLLLLLLIRSY